MSLDGRIIPRINPQHAAMHYIIGLAQIALVVPIAIVK